MLTPKIKARSHGSGSHELHQRLITLKDGKFEFEPSLGNLDTQGKANCCHHNDEATFPSNEIISSKYTVWNFLPKNLGIQLAPWLKPANFYFLCIAVLQSIHEISTTDGTPMILGPLLFVLGITAIKDAYEDYTRHKIDDERNYSEFQISRNGQWITIFAKDLAVGDLVLIKESMTVPADILLLCSGEFGGSHCYIDTKSLDGETNLKAKYVPGKLLQGFQNVKDQLPENQDECIKNLPHIVRLHSHPPDENVHEWFADIEVETKDSERKNSNNSNEQKSKNKEHLNIDHLILNYSKLKGSPWIVGMVVYTGEDTKIRQNIGSRLAVLFKQTRVFEFTKKVLATIAGIEVILCTLFGILAAVMRRDDWFSYHIYNREIEGVLRALTWCILMKDIIPIAMYVTLEIVQFSQAFFVYWDIEMSFVRNGEREWAICQTSNLSEELGEIQYILTDKTGTLTENSMSFKKCIIGGVQYGTGTTVAGVIKRCRENRLCLEEELEVHEEEQKKSKCSHPHVNFNEEGKMRKLLTTALESKDTENEHHKELREFFFCLALNNIIFPKNEGKGEIDTNNPNSDTKLLMESNSPDEAALSCFSQWLGVELFSRKGNKTWVRIGHHTSFTGTSNIDDNNSRNVDTKSNHHREPYFKRFEEICVIKFSSKRKRMTCIVQELDPVTGEVDPNGKLRVYCKGADSVVKKLCEKRKVQGNEKKIEEKKTDNWWMPTQKKLDEFGDESLRCLVVAFSEKDQSWWYGNGDADSLQAKYEKAKESENLTDKEKGHDVGFCSNECALCKVENEIEYAADLEVLGITAIEDKLQDQVPQTLKKLLKAEIKIWMLTGDNIKAGINIGISCNMIDTLMDKEGRLFKLDNDIRSVEDIEAKIIQFEKTISACRETLKNSTFGVAIHSDTWKLIYNDEEKNMTQKFFDFASKCNSVIACRLEPKEKADMVVMVRELEKARGNKDVRVLSIGDGNNDTPMIKQADVGVGLRGSEGTQAVAHADFVISQFKFMQKLILVYGRLNARRIAETINYIFYKALFLVLALAFFGAYSIFSGTPVFLDWAYQCHNTVFTSMPIVIFGVFDRDLHKEVMLTFPQIYAFSRGTFHSLAIFLRWQALGVVQILIIFFIPWYSTDSEILDSSGQIYGIWSKGAVVYTSLVITSITKLAFDYRSWMWPHWLFFIGSIVLFFIAMIVFSASSAWAVGGGDYYFVWYRLWLSPSYWLITLLTIACANLVDLILQCKRVFNPTAMDLIVLAANEKLNIKDPIALRAQRMRNIAHILRGSKNLRSSVRIEPGPDTPLNNQESHEGIELASIPDKPRANEKKHIA